MTTDTEIRNAEAPAVQRNTVGLIALILAISGAVFAVIPGAAIIGWLLLPAAFVLAIVSLFLKNQKRSQGIAALVISIVGTLIGVLAFIAMLSNAVDEAFTDNVEIQAPADDAVEAVEDDSGANDSSDDESNNTSGDTPGDDAADGTRANPLPVGSTITTSDWEVTVNSVDLDATAAILAENQFNNAPEDGHVYILVELTAAYVGTDPDGDSPWVGLEYVSASGNSFESYDAFISAPNSFDQLGTLYEGASTTGNIALQVPADNIADGTLRVKPTLFGDPVFFAVQ